MAERTLGDLEQKMPAIDWRAPVEIGIAPEDLVMAVAAPQAHPEAPHIIAPVRLLGCRACIANLGFQAAFWEVTDFVFRCNPEHFDPADAFAKAEARRDAEALFERHLRKVHGVMADG